MERDSRRQKSSASKKRPYDQVDNGRKKKPKSGLDDGSMSSRPVETIYRILCPIKKIGSVLGRGGDIISALREETQAKIRVVDALPGAEERVIIIYNYAKQSREVDASENSDNESGIMKPLCTAQDALLKIHDRIAADESLYVTTTVKEDKEEGDIVARILVPSSQVGCLLGKGGTIIQKLRTDTGAGIRVLPSDQLPQCAMSTDELVQITGSAPLVRKALYEISTRLHQHHHKDNPPLDLIISSSTKGNLCESQSPPHQGNPEWLQQYVGLPPPIPWNDAYRIEPLPFAPHSYDLRNEAAEEFSVKILCAAGRIGGIIGKGGSTVKQLEDQTGARIQVEESNKDAEERIIVVSSKEIPSDRISPTIEALLLLQSKINVTPDKSQLTTRLVIPSTKVGCILGEGGKIITEMRKRTRADIRIFSKEDKPKFLSSDDELVQVSGNSVAAKEALTEIASRLRARTFRGASSVEAAVPQGPYLSREYPPSGRSLGNSAALHGTYPGYPPVDRLPSQEFKLYGSPPVNHALHSQYSGREYQSSRHAPTNRFYNREYLSEYHNADSYPPSRDFPHRGYDHYAAREYRSPFTAGKGSHHGYAPHESYPSREQLNENYPSRGHAPESYASRGPPPESYASRGPPPESYPVRLPPAESFPVRGVPSDNYPRGPPPESYQSRRALPESYSSRGPPLEIYNSRGAPAESYPGRGPPLEGYQSRGPPQESYLNRTAPPESYQSWGGPPESYSSRGHPPEGYSARGPVPESYSTRGPARVGNPSNYEPYNYMEAAGQVPDGYHGHGTDSGYSKSKSTIEISIPVSAVQSLYGIGGNNLTEIRQISGARVKLHECQPGSSECIVEINGTPDQFKAAKSLIQQFISTDGPGITQSHPARPYH